jgi:hypothetical protein
MGTFMIGPKSLQNRRVAHQPSDSAYNSRTIMPSEMATKDTIYMILSDTIGRIREDGLDPATTSGTSTFAKSRMSENCLSRFDMEMVSGTGVRTRLQ